jgi:putative transposase
VLVGVDGKERGAEGSVSAVASTTSEGFWTLPTFKIINHTMKKNTLPMQCGTFYHVYNRGINGEDLFKEDRNYSYFLKLYAKYIPPIAETYAYCLLKNHFHLLIRVRSEEEVMLNTSFPNVGRVLNPSDVTMDVTTIAAKRVSNQFSKLFNSYAQAINKAYGRTGGLFEELFRRIPVEDENYLVQLVYYIHANPQKHGFVADFRDYPHSSYHTHLSKLDTQLRRRELLDWFGDPNAYEKYHLPNQILNNLDKFDLEFD